ncbi:MAG: DUF1294 domain-containing protein [Clostridiales bacterium]|nr:DUF1294 domain-containing protein [Clostridiales bacterium]
MEKYCQIIILLYYIALNAVLFTAMGADKYKAVHKKWRIPEATLFLLALSGGFIGGFSGMFIFHHKTRKPKFYFVFSLAFILHAFIIVNLFMILR